MELNTLGIHHPGFFFSIFQNKLESTFSSGMSVRSLEVGRSTSASFEIHINLDFLSTFQSCLMYLTEYCLLVICHGFLFVSVHLCLFVCHCIYDHKSKIYNLQRESGFILCDVLPVHRCICEQNLGYLEAEF